MNDSRSGFGSLHMPRSRGAVSGLFLIILGVWGALAPFVGPYFHFAYSPGGVWVWNIARAWLEVFPGAVTALGGFLLLISGNRATAVFGGWLSVIGGAWFVVGRALASTLRLGDIGHPLASTDAKRAVIEIALFSGLGALIVFFGGAALARMSARMARDLEFARNAEPLPAADTSAFTENTATTVIAPSAARKHRRKSKRGLFNNATSQSTGRPTPTG
jgi:hypothetical protein